MADFFVHNTSVVDENVQIGEGTKIWHFSHVLSNSIIGNNCSFGQNCMVGPNVTIGSRVKVQNNISIYDGVKMKTMCFWGLLWFYKCCEPKKLYCSKGRIQKNTFEKRKFCWGKCHYCLWSHRWYVRPSRSRKRCDKRCETI